MEALGVGKALSTFANFFHTEIQGEFKVQSLLRTQFFSMILRVVNLDDMKDRDED